MENKVRILGIDPGLQVCGYALLDVDSAGETLVEAGVFRTDRSQPIEMRLNRIADDIEIVLEKFSPAVVAVEQLYSHYAHPETAILMGHARGVILQKCAKVGIEVKSFSATRVKKSVTGNGRASKEQVQRSIQTAMGLPELPQPNDVADAIAVAVCYANSMNSVSVGGNL